MGESCWTTCFEAMCRGLAASVETHGGITSSQLYFLANNPYRGRVKIGITDDLDANLREYRLRDSRCYYMVSFAATEDDLVALHKKYEGRRVVSAWFQFSLTEARDAARIARVAHERT